jgi:hypothetical protein
VQEWENARLKVEKLRKRGSLDPEKACKHINTSQWDICILREQG